MKPRHVPGDRIQDAPVRFFKGVAPGHTPALAEEFLEDGRSLAREYGAAKFGYVANAADPRSIQVAAKLHF